MNFSQGALAAMSALIHVYIFVLESILWQSNKTRRIFKLTEEQAILTRDLAYNQGFYNLFIALQITAGLVFHQATLVHFGMASIMAAALVLWTRNPKLKRAALIQGLPAVFYFVLFFR